jgi:hypothetical protein
MVIETELARLRLGGRGRPVLKKAPTCTRAGGIPRSIIVARLCPDGILHDAGLLALEGAKLRLAYPFTVRGQVIVETPKALSPPDPSRFSLLPHGRAIDSDIGMSN